MSYGSLLTSRTGQRTRNSPPVHPFLNYHHPQPNPPFFLYKIRKPSSKLSEHLVSSFFSSLLVREQWVEEMDGGKRNQSLKLAIFVFHSLLALLISTTPIHALNIGVQSVNSGITSSNQQKCSRTCESQHCNSPDPFLKYGKYCGILYSGCPGEKPCDALDACCMTHDNCIQSKNNDYFDVECNENFLDCIAEVRNSGKGTFKGNKCMVEEVADAIALVIEVALIAGRVLHNP